MSIGYNLFPDAINNGSRGYENLNNGIRPECMATATKIENLMVIPPEYKFSMRSSMARFQNKQNT